MIYARVINGVILDMASLSDLYPTTTFASGGPSSSWLAGENLFEIQMQKNYDPATEKLQQTQPYVEAGIVYGVVSVPLTPEEITNLENAEKQQVKNIAKQLLLATDWSQLPDVQLQNLQDFVTYRSVLRAIVINPIINPTWPILPEPIWIA